jgi:lysophospholipid acyltransferase (LPLAT)-like uncharacterized protein
MSLFKRIGASPAVQRTLGVLGAEYLRLVWKTNSFTIEPADFYERLPPELPIIVAMWHGQHFMSLFLRRPEHKCKTLISRHRDGEFNAIAVERLGIPAIRGSGDHERRFDRKGGVGAFKSMLDALADGWSLALTADVPKVSRVAGTGIVTLARFSGRPIYPMAAATSRRIQFDNWDRSEFNLPFGRFAIVMGAPIRVAADADEVALEAARQAVEASLNAATMRVHDLVDRTSERGNKRR